MFPSAAAAAGTAVRWRSGRHHRPCRNGVEGRPGAGPGRTVAAATLVVLVEAGPGAPARRRRPTPVSATCTTAADCSARPRRTGGVLAGAGYPESVIEVLGPRSARHTAARRPTTCRGEQVGEQIGAPIGIPLPHSRGHLDDLAPTRGSSVAGAAFLIFVASRGVLEQKRMYSPNRRPGLVSVAADPVQADQRRRSGACPRRLEVPRWPGSPFAAQSASCGPAGTGTLRRSRRSPAHDGSGPEGRAARTRSLTSPLIRGHARSRLDQRQRHNRAPGAGGGISATRRGRQRDAR